MWDLKWENEGAVMRYKMAFTGNKVKCDIKMQLQEMKSHLRETYFMIYSNAVYSIILVV